MITPSFRQYCFKRSFSFSPARLRDVQRLTFTGNLVRDAERLQSQRGNPYMKYTVASNNGKDVPATFRTVFFFDDREFDRMEAILKKGNHIFVEANTVYRKAPSGDSSNPTPLSLSLQHLNVHILKRARSLAEEEPAEKDTAFETGPLPNSF
ncbi:single-stranded DNA binding protein Rim1 [Schizosaccharomyces cryophilus OY26]|uniref:Single-stranded DNA binding protein Rim1 n=1 Tax=Schizosaccharomyces cryophilus (strain OY26 / ATCC MYA-4695 / CBS 11777 / NBRC 106824 / NRRL Y48691) TaxID=653667 RepID=S9XCD4_SCHCR|nr:single-stranded DNA binding protein Rim1 [Schizosaccharomyces cryophilus OY26]EPY51506.1 single-stranded DNA binding protein Rim1 [Schizosaccharomyces cryophilus OY26]